MKSYTLIHDWRDGFGHYDIRCDIDIKGSWCDGLELPDEIEHIIQKLEIDFEPDKGESITIEEVEESPTEFSFL